MKASNSFAGGIGGGNLDAVAAPFDQDWLKG